MHSVRRLPPPTEQCGPSSATCPFYPASRGIWQAGETAKTCLRTSWSGNSITNMFVDGGGGGRQHGSSGVRGGGNGQACHHQRRGLDPVPRFSCRGRAGSPDVDMVREAARQLVVARLEGGGAARRQAEGGRLHGPGARCACHDMSCYDMSLTLAARADGAAWLAACIACTLCDTRP